MPDIREIDWKHFKELHGIAEERFAHNCLQQVQYHLTDQTKSALDRFLEIRDIARACERKRASLFDDFRRSSAIVHIAMMRSETLITDEEMLRFSQALRELVSLMLSTRA